MIAALRNIVRDLLLAIRKTGGGGVVLVMSRRALFDLWR